MKIAHILWHVPEGDEYKENAKLIGVYSSSESAAAAVARLRNEPGFVNYPQGFEVDAYELDKDHWSEGFGIA